MSKCISDPNKECTNRSCGMLRWCAEVKTVKKVEPPSIFDAIKEGACSCEVCVLGISQPMSEWLKNPLHKQIHERIMTAIIRDEIQVQGETE